MRQNNYMCLTDTLHVQHRSGHISPTAPSVNGECCYSGCTFRPAQGKSHLSHALAHEAARQGYDILFTSAHQMLVHINAGRADGTAEKRLAVYTKPRVLVIDDVGLKPLPPSGPADLYDVINERYERASIVLTSNRAPGEWPDLFGNPLLASAGLDRLAHRAIMLTITGRSYRLAQRADGTSTALFAAPASGADDATGVTPL